MLTNEFMGTGYWEREMDVKSFKPTVVHILYSQNLGIKSRKKLIMYKTNDFLKCSFSRISSTIFVLTTFAYN